MRLKAKGFRKNVCATAIACALASPALANPNGPTVVNGQARFQVNGNSLTVTNTPGAIINWQGFSIAADELTRFLQQSPVSSVLNRVTSANPSEVLGRLQSNGRVFIVNPNGIVFGPGSQVDVAGLAASTLNISNADFVSGRHVFSATGAEGKVINQGEIVTPAGGKVFLIAPQVENKGIIRAPSGEIVLAAGTTVRFIDANFPSIQVEVTASAGKDLPLGNLGRAAAGKVFAFVVKQSGVVSASAASIADGGKVVLRSAGEVQLAAGSRTEAVGAAVGGTVEVEAPRVLVAHAGSIDVSGVSGGGRVAILGEKVLFAGTIDAHAIKSGEGGKVVLKSDGEVQLAAGSRIEAVGTATGGTVEIKAPRVLVAYSGSIDVSGTSGGGRAAIVGERVLFAGTIDARAIKSGEGGKVVLKSDGEVQLAAGSRIEAVGAATGGTVAIEAPRALIAYSGSIDVSGVSGGGRVAILGEKVLFAGTIDAHAIKSGEGGSVEVSGRQSLVFAGTVDTRGGAESSGTPGTSGKSATSGTAGTLVIDPARITVVAGSTGTPAALADGTWSSNENTGSQTVGATELSNLLRTTSVTLQATEGVVVSADAVIEAGTPGRSLTLQAPQVLFHGTIRTTSAAVDLNIDAKRAHVTQGAQLALGGGRLNVSAQSVMVEPAQEAQQPRMQQALQRAVTNPPPEVTRLRAEVQAEIERDNARLAAAMSQSCAKVGAPKQGCTVGGGVKRFAFAG